MSSVMVSKTTLVAILGDSMFKLAMFMAGGTQEGQALKIIFENVEDFDLTSDFIQNHIIPMLVSINVFDNNDVAKISSYISSVGQ